MTKAESKFLFDVLEENAKMYTVLLHIVSLAGESDDIRREAQRQAKTVLAEVSMSSSR